MSAIDERLDRVTAGNLRIVGSRLAHRRVGESGSTKSYETRADRPSRHHGHHRYEGDVMTMLDTPRRQSDDEIPGLRMIIDALGRQSGVRQLEAEERAVLDEMLARWSELAALQAGSQVS